MCMWDVFCRYYNGIWYLFLKFIYILKICNKIGLKKVLYFCILSTNDMKLCYFELVMYQYPHKNIWTPVHFFVSIIIAQINMNCSCGSRHILWLFHSSIQTLNTILQKKKINLLFYFSHLHVIALSQDTYSVHINCNNNYEFQNSLNIEWNKFYNIL